MQSNLLVRRIAGVQKELVCVSLKRFPCLDKVRRRSPSEDSTVIFECCGHHLINRMLSCTGGLPTGS